LQERFDILAGVETMALAFEAVTNLLHIPQPTQMTAAHAEEGGDRSTCLQGAVGE
jgi:hypothetical protein